MKKIVYAVVTLVTMSACATGRAPKHEETNYVELSYLALDNKAVDLTSGQRLKPVKAKFCSSEVPALERRGMLNEAARKLLGESGGTYLINVRAEPTGDNCLYIEGTPVKTL